MMKLASVFVAASASLSVSTVAAMHSGDVDEHLSSDEHISPAAVREELVHLKDPPMFPEVPGTAVAVRAPSTGAISGGSYQYGSQSQAAAHSVSRASSVAGSSKSTKSTSSKYESPYGNGVEYNKKGRVGSITSQDGQRYIKVLSAKETDGGGFARA